MKPSRLMLTDRAGSGLQIKAQLHEEVDCAEFTMRADAAQTVFEGVPLSWKDGQWFMVGTETWIQFEPKKWSEMQRVLFQQMVDAWNEKYGQPITPQVEASPEPEAPQQ